MLQTKPHIMSFDNRTKIIATLGPASNNNEMIRELIETGVNVFRLNFSHGTHEQHAEVIAIIHALNEELQTNVGILADLQGPKIRLGMVNNDQVVLESGQKVYLTTNEMEGTAEKLYIAYPDFAADVSSGEKILMDDGKIELQAIQTNGVDEVVAEVIYGGVVSSRKGVNLPQTNISMPTLTQKDIKDLEFVCTQNVNWIALSFVRRAEDVVKLRGALQFKNHPARIIAKIEKPEAVQNMDRIIQVSDAVMIARGDLGVELPLQRIPMIQKEIIRKCIRAAKPVIIATQMMESMMENPSPTRAEVTDVATGIFDGADALMLSGETAVGKHPVRVIETFMKVIKHIEKQGKIYNRDHVAQEESPTFLSDAICYNACRIGDDVNAKAIIGMTKSGYTAFVLSSFRPNANVYIFTESKELLNSVSLVWGVHAFYYNKFESTDDSIRDVQNILLKKGLIEQGDVVINTGSMPLHERGRTNTIKVSLI